MRRSERPDGLTAIPSHTAEPASVREHVLVVGESQELARDYHPSSFTETQGHEETNVVRNFRG